MMKRLMFIPLVILALLLQALAAYGTEAGCFATTTYQSLVAHADQSPCSAEEADEYEKYEEHEEEESY